MTEARTYMGGHTNLITPRDWQIQAQAEAADGYAAKIAEAKRYGAMADALEAAQAENAQWRVDFKEMLIERDAALARLAEIESTHIDGLMLEKSLANLKAQEPAYLLTPDGKCYAYGSAQPLSAGHADATLLKLYTAAGASPVEPSESVEHRDELAKRKPEPAAETVGGLAKAVKAARGGDAPPAPMRGFA